jgi:hypothetical protein
MERIQVKEKTIACKGSRDLPTNPCQGGKCSMPKAFDGATPSSNCMDAQQVTLWINVQINLGHGLFRALTLLLCGEYP